MSRTVRLVGLLSVLAIAPDRSGAAEATPAKAANGASNTKGLSLETYSAGLLSAITKGAKVKEVDRYTPTDDVTPKHCVHVLDQGDGKGFWYVTNGLDFVRQPGSTPGSEVFMELATWSDGKDVRIGEILSLLGEAMHHQANGRPLNAWNYDTISLSQDVCGLRYFVLRPGAELKMPRKDQREQLVSIFTVIPLTASERTEVANVGRERARAWVEKRAIESPAAMLARWRMPPGSTCAASAR
jgi:hypothetical protein